MRFYCLPALLLLALFWFGAASSGTAQDIYGIPADNLSRAVQRQDLDSFWLEQRKWMAYGYRPRVKAHLTPFTNLPSYSAGRNYYSYGVDLPAPSLKNPYDKKSVQLTKYGTWH